MLSLSLLALPISRYNAQVRCKLTLLILGHVSDRFRTIHFLANDFNDVDFAATCQQLIVKQKRKSYRIVQ